jgi:hypothetical protein
MNVLKHRQLIFTVLLAGLACFNGFKWAWQISQSPYQALDFRTYYIGAKTYFSHLNPYYKNDQTITWLKMPNHETSPNFDAHETVVYAPQFVWFFGPYQLLDFNQAKHLQLALNILSLLLIVWLVKQMQSQIPVHMIALGIGAFKGTWFALSNGQPMIQITLLIILSFYLIFKKHWHWLPGIILGFCGFKFTLLIPVGLFLLTGKHFKTFSTMAVVMLLLNTLAINNCAVPDLMLKSWQYNLSYLFNYNHVFHSLNGINIINTSSSVVLKYYLDLPNSTIHFAYTLLLLVLSTGVVWMHRNASGFRPLLVLSLLTFCFGQHLMYDVLVIIIYWMLQYEAKKEPYSALLLAASLCLPLSLAAGQIPIIHFVIPLLLLIYTIEALYSDYRFSRNKVTKKAS